MAASIKALTGSSASLHGALTATLPEAKHLQPKLHCGSFMKQSSFYSTVESLNPSRRSENRLFLQSRRSLAARASGEEAEKAPFGLGGPGTFWGFGKRQEREVGRVAMMGFMAGLIMEVLTGKGVLGQLGMDPVTVRYPFLLGLLFLTVAGLLGGYVVINNPPDFEKVPPNDGAGLPRNPLKTFDPNNAEPLTMYTRGGVVEKNGQMAREPYATDLDLPKK